MRLSSEKIDSLSVWAVVAIGFLILIGGIWQIRSTLFVHRNTVFAAFHERTANLNQDQASFLNSSPDDQALASGEVLDTDQDGIGDTDESTYNTSPYLADSDSDSLSDKEEIDAGTDPNCPTGAECEQERTGGTGDASTEAQSAFSELSNTNSSADSISKYLNSDGSINAPQLRQALVAQGVPQTEVDKISDEDLAQAFTDIMAGANSGASSTTEVQDYAQSLRDATPAEKRSFLLQSGAKQEDLDKLTDEQVNEALNSMIDETLKEQDLTPQTEGQ
ncbi:MAG: hypothetical protein A2233_04355 [Candidatus Kerfeldbacteria bacterium RIFOXYA2_FULL_38_24]|uniref:Uncharacterized protein n=1 Tax=Candidatus Kerfeldbacteria bacterium RIFOXYB2_FULL_38_14 TaxID=1798547 RepID=A0A1G2BF99_9BACT|nr:MAG: hypothetical protein A2233_04355 [Candidatus Kerfeldbacteria bacterium RIFOXYA2_FULL_38_24]OGY86950.1 MAG: hypothetical protein A2319_00200 [Candidatus Kerfeldbacteria bacterium RIFOXYB2_FULL_38_14]